MTGLELLKAPEATAGEIADIISAPCPPIIPAHCDGVSCRACWLAWTSGRLWMGRVFTLAVPTQAKLAGLRYGA